MTKQWEYKIEERVIVAARNMAYMESCRPKGSDCVLATPVQAHELLGVLGAEGWELVAAIQTGPEPSKVCYHFKREVAQDKPFTILSTSPEFVEKVAEAMTASEVNQRYADRLASVSQVELSPGVIGINLLKEYQDWLSLNKNKIKSVCVTRDDNGRIIVTEGSKQTADLLNFLRDKPHVSHEEARDLLKFVDTDAIFSCNKKSINGVLLTDESGVPARAVRVKDGMVQALVDPGIWVGVKP